MVDMRQDLQSWAHESDVKIFVDKYEKRKACQEVEEEIAFVSGKVTALLDELESLERELYAIKYG